MTSLNDLIETAIKALARKAENPGNPSDALHFSQAALNLAHTQATLEATRKAPF